MSVPNNWQMRILMLQIKLPLVLLRKKGETNDYICLYDNILKYLHKFKCYLCLKPSKGTQCPKFWQSFNKEKKMKNNKNPT